MNIQQKIVATAAVVLVGSTVINTIMAKKAQKREDKLQELALQRDLDIIATAALKVNERVQAGEYNEVGIAGIDRDLRFEIIVAHLND